MGTAKVQSGVSEEVVSKWGLRINRSWQDKQGERQFWQREQQMQRHRGMKDGGEFGGNVCRERGRAGAQGHTTGCRGRVTKGDSPQISEGHNRPVEMSWVSREL